MKEEKPTEMLHHKVPYKVEHMAAVTVMAIGLGDGKVVTLELTPEQANQMSLELKRPVNVNGTEL